MKLDARKKLVLKKETLRSLTIKTGVKAGGPEPPTYNPVYC